MRIGIDARPLISKQPSGIGIYLRNIIEYIQSVDRTNEYILYSNREFEQDYVLPENFTIRVIDGKIGTLWVYNTLPKYLKKDRIDTFWGTEHILPKRAKNVRCVLTVHDIALLINSHWGTRKNAVIQNLFLRKSLKRADQIIAISESTANDLKKMRKKQKNNISMIYNGGASAKDVDAAQIDYVKDKFHISENYFLYLGTIEPRKNVDTVIKAFSEFSKTNPDVSLVLAGGLGWKYQSTLDLIEKSQNEKIFRLGYVQNDEKAALLKGATAFVFPSHYEGFGIPVLEAMAYGVPVITAKNSSLIEVGGDAALFLSDENSVEDLVVLTQRVISASEEERYEIIQRGYVQAAKFSWEKCARETLSVLTGQDKNI